MLTIKKNSPKMMTLSTVSEKMLENNLAKKLQDLVIININPGLAQEFLVTLCLDDEKI